MSFMGHRQEQRYAVLRHMYEFAVVRLNDPTHKFGEAEIAEDLSYLEQDVKAALNYLVGEYLAEVKAIYDGGNKSYQLTHAGIKEVERSWQEPSQNTFPFPTPSNITIENLNGAFQIAQHAAANVNQNIGTNLSDVLNLVEKLKAQVSELPQDKQEGATDSLEMLEDELNSQTRNPERIRRSLERLGRMAQSTATFLSQVLTLSQQLKALNLFEK